MFPLNPLSAIFDIISARHTYRLKVMAQKNIFYVNENNKKARVAILISDKINLKIKAVTKEKEGLYIMIEGSIQEEYITIANIYVPNIRTPQYKRHMIIAIKGKWTVTH